MHILITGSSGQIGTNLGLSLLADGHRVTGIDVRPNPWTGEVPTVVRNLYLPLHDRALPTDVDVVVHLAANAKVHELVENPVRAMENIQSTFTVLEYCVGRALPMIFSSSREVYGDIHRYVTEESHADFSYTESPYSASKISAEAFAYSYARCYGLRYIVFRFSNVYGRYDNDLERMERVIPLFIRRISRGEPITIYGENKILDFTYVDDCVAGIRAGIDLLAAGGSSHTINLAYGEGNTLVTVARLIGEALGVEPAIHVERSRAGEVTHYVADIAKARELLGYSPDTPLAEGIPKAVEWSMSWWRGESPSRLAR